MNDNDELIIEKILNRILMGAAGIREVILMDRTGITITYVSKLNTNKEINIDKIGAIGGAVFQAVEEQGECLEYGKIKSQITEYEKGYIFSIDAGEGILLVSSDSNVNVGLTIALMKKYSKALAKILERYLKQDSEEIAEELKSLVNENNFNLF